ncbi:MAG TPA: TlpA disulfide reductase family protein [Candidatus Krumholzibacteria bacterium]|nr:TlpA disulfide reductase family protein [Candidatus Krumholzibacteria bacterium]
MPLPFSGPVRYFAWGFVVSLAVAVSVAAKSEDPSQTLDPIAAVADTSLALSGKVVYVDFWASWCGPCRQSLPWLNGLLQRYGDRGFRLVTVDVDRKPAAGRKFLKDLGVSFPVVFDSTGTFAKKYQLQAMPTSFIYGRDGKLRERREGFHEGEAYGVEDQIEDLLQQKGVK